MKVLLASFDTPETLHGGVEWYVHHLAAALRDEGVEARIAARRPAHPVADEAWVRVPAGFGQPPYRHRLWADPSYDAGVRRAARWADVVHGQNVDGHGALGVRPVVTTVHTTPVDEWDSARLGGWREATYQRPLQARRVRRWRRDAPRWQHTWAVAQAVADNARVLGADPVEVAENPAPPVDRLPYDEARARLGLEGPVALFLGRLTRVKGAHRLLAALPDLPDWTLLVAGDGPEAVPLRAQAEPLGDRVRFLGRVSEEDKRVLLSAVDVFCLPSQHEGQPLSLLEAAAYGLPLVTRPDWVQDRLREQVVPDTDLVAALAQARSRGRRVPPDLPTYRDLARRFAARYADVC